MNKALLYLFFAFCYSCGQADCGLHEKPVGWHTSFNKSSWQEGHLDQGNSYLGSADSSYLYYRILRNREKMLCDLVKNKLKPQQNIDEVIDMLGPGEKYYPRGKILFEPDNSRSNLLDEIYETRLSYQTGYNASGICHLILVFDKNRYIGCYRTVAQ